MAKRLQEPAEKISKLSHNQSQRVWNPKNNSGGGMPLHPFACMLNSHVARSPIVNILHGSTYIHPTP